MSQTLCVCVWERVSEGMNERVCVCVCVCVCVYVCVCVSSQVKSSQNFL